MFQPLKLATVFVVAGLCAVLCNVEADAKQPRNRVGKIKVPFTVNQQIGRELAIREPSMCEGRAGATVKWNRRRNKVAIDLRFDGLPYRPTFAYDYDPSTPYNQYPMEVSNGRWQLWVLGRMFTITSVFYYDAVTGDLIANEFDLPNGPPEDAIPIELPLVQMVCSDFFESNRRNLKARVHLEFDYDRLVDAAGNGGVLNAILPTNIFDADDPDVWDIYYTNGGLPLSASMHWDDVVDDLESALTGGPGGLILATSYEPFPKPEYLVSRDNLMIGWAGQYPPGILPHTMPPPGFEKCGTYQLPGDFSMFIPPME